MWQRTLGTAVPSATAADADGNGRVERADLDPWQLRFGKTNIAPSATLNQLAVPEPAAFPLGLAAAIALALTTRLRLRDAEPFVTAAQTLPSNCPAPSRSRARFACCTWRAIRSRDG
jgi:hypothetical protein